MSFALQAFANRPISATIAAESARDDSAECRSANARSACNGSLNRPTPTTGRSTAFRMALGESDMLAYLSMMALRLIELRRVLKPTGSIYLHCDPTASHYLKMLMDAVFGPVNFCNEIISSKLKPRKPFHPVYRCNSMRLKYYLRSKTSR